MIQDFSQGYYCMSMDVQEYDNGPVISEPVYSFIQSYLFRQPTDVIMRVGLDAGPIFSVSSESAVPRDVLALPEELISQTGTADVFILKPEYEDVIGEYNG